MRRPVLAVASKENADLLKAMVAGYTRSDGTAVAAHNDSRQSAIKAVPHPKGHKVGAQVFFPHPEKPGKNALGKYKGERGGKSVIEHSTGEHDVEHDHVKSARGVPKQADSKKTAEAGQALRDYQASEAAKK